MIRLPKEEEIGREFGWVECSNELGECGRYPQARLSALTDLLNRIVIETFFVPWKQSERELALEHIQALAPEDIAILDRGYASYPLWVHFIAHQRYFVCRCPRSSFGVVNRLFQANEAGRSVIVEVRVPPEHLAAIRQAGLPEVITSVLSPCA